jgi:hypothetical protein
MTIENVFEVNKALAIVLTNRLNAVPAYLTPGFFAGPCPVVKLFTVSKISGVRPPGFVIFGGGR